MIIERVGKVVLDTTLDGLGRSSARILMTTGELLYHIVGMGPRRISDLEAGQPSVGRSPACHKRRGLLERQPRCDGACLHSQDSLVDRLRRNRQRRLSCGDPERLPRSTTQRRDDRPQDGPGGARSRGQTMLEWDGPDAYAEPPLMLSKEAPATGYTVDLLH